MSDLYDACVSKDPSHINCYGVALLLIDGDTGEVLTSSKHWQDKSKVILEPLNVEHLKQQALGSGRLRREMGS